MSGLGGWFQARHEGEAWPGVIAAMAATIGRFDGSSIRSASAGFGALAALARGRGADVFQSDSQLVAICGHVRFTDGQLDHFAQSKSVAHAVAQGYADKGIDVFAAMSGSFALAILSGSSGEAVL